MRNLKFHLIAAQNFLCFRDRVEFHFEDYSNIVLIKGYNYDVMKNGQPGSNGSGKSSISEILSYCFYGKTIKPPKKISHADVLHSWNPQKLETEVQIDDYRIIRTRKPDRLRVWQSKDHLWDKESELTLGTMAETQKFIEEHILGINHEAFCNIVVFDDANTQGFLKCDVPTKRKVIENILGLECYKDYFENSKEFLKSYKDGIKVHATEYQMLLTEIDHQTNMVSKVSSQESDWLADLTKQCDNLMLRIKQKQQHLETFDINKELEKYQKNQDEILDLTSKIPALEEKKLKVSDILSEAREKLDKLREDRNELQLKSQEHKSNILSAQSKIKEHEELRTSLTTLKEGEKCPVCHAIVDSSNYGSVLTHAENIVDSQKQKAEKETVLYEKVAEIVKSKDIAIKKLQVSIQEAENTLSAFELKIESSRKNILELSKIPKPQIGTEARILENEIVDLRKQYDVKKGELVGKTPYKEIKEEAINKLSEVKEKSEKKKDIIKGLEDDLPYLEYWKEGFGDRGIRKLVIDGVVPALNSRLAYLMQYLIEDQIKITFDNELEEIIQQKPDDGNPFVYYILSNGEKQRIELALSQALSYIRMLECGTCFGILFLDEITKGAIDFNGVQGIYNMILELAKERQIFITTHDVHLLNLLDGCDIISLKKKDGFTTIL